VLFAGLMPEDKAVDGAYIGTAGWPLPKQLREFFDGPGSNLSQYARKLNCVEINSSFYKIHQPKTYARWAAEVPEHFRFATKLYRRFTQELRLKESGEELREWIGGISALGPKGAVLLVQLPPSLELDWRVAERFLRDLRSYYPGAIVWEPRHPSWKSGIALDLLETFGVSKVRAHPDPCYVPRRQRERVESMIYYRLHGKPEIYRSNYEHAKLAALADCMRHELSKGKEVWCVFDNTTFGFATENALELTYGNTSIPNQPEFHNLHREHHPVPGQGPGDRGLGGGPGA
jgi:uncharacterized protein YecE (DUF72 family)